MKLGLLTAVLIVSTGAFAQDAPKSLTVGDKPLVRVKPKPPFGCTLVGTVKGTKLWAGDCTASDQLRSSVPATENSEPPLLDRAIGVIPPGQK
jgi:hypothetical protein